MQGKLLCCVNGNKGDAVLRAIHKEFPTLDLIVATAPQWDAAHVASRSIQDFSTKSDLETAGWRSILSDRNWVHEHGVDAIVLVGWQFLVPAWLLAALPRRVIVAHDSLLPRYRGFAPLPTALIQGETETGVSVFLAEPDVDTGDVIFQGRIAIEPNDHIAALMERIEPLYVEGMIHAVSGLIGGALEARPQNHDQATHSIWRDGEDYFVDWNDSAERIERTIRALGPPYAGARSHLGEQVVILDRAEVEPDLSFEIRQVGKVWRLSEAGEPVVICGEGLLRITRALIHGAEIIPMKRLRVRFS